MRKRTSEYIKKLPLTQRQELAKILGCKGSSVNSIAQVLSTPFGLSNVLYSLTNMQYRVFLEITKDEAGTTFGQLEIALSLKSEELNEIVKVLENKLLIFVLKNRQHIHNKSDKLIAFTDIQESFHPFTVSMLQEMFKALYHAASKSAKPQSNVVRKTIYSIITKIVQKGGIISLQELVTESSNSKLRTTVEELLHEKFIVLVHTPHPPFDAYIVLTPKAIEGFAWHQFENTYSHNRYALLLNILALYDGISTHGLFLTQQQNFRKVDIDRLHQALVAMEGIYGKKIPPQTIFQLCISLMHRCNLVALCDDAIEVSLAKVNTLLDRPHDLLYEIISLPEPMNTPSLFEPPFAIPSREDIKKLMELIFIHNDMAIGAIPFVATTKDLAKMNLNEFEDIAAIAKQHFDAIANTLQFLHLIGAIKIYDEKVLFSDIGEYLGSKLGLPISTPSLYSNKKIVYINPDFTAIIPREGLTSYEYYMLLSRMEVTKDDVMINAKITYQSILNAHKRGMGLDNFVCILESISKTVVPQNLIFLLKEWINQAIEVHILSATIIKVNHAEFLDELAASKHKSAIIERIIPTIAIIDKSQIDTIIKIARRKNSIIRLFSQ